AFRTFLIDTPEGGCWDDGAGKEGTPAPARQTVVRATALAAMRDGPVVPAVPPSARSAAADEEAPREVRVVGEELVEDRRQRRAERPGQRLLARRRAGEHLEAPVAVPVHRGHAHAAQRGGVGGDERGGGAGAAVVGEEAGQLAGRLAVEDADLGHRAGAED